MRDIYSGAYMSRNARHILWSLHVSESETYTHFVIIISKLESRNFRERIGSELYTLSCEKYSLIWNLMATARIYRTNLNTVVSFLLKSLTWRINQEELPIKSSILSLTVSDLLSHLSSLDLSPLRL